MPGMPLPPFPGMRNVFVAAQSGGSAESFLDNSWENFKLGTVDNVEILWLKDNENRMYVDGQLRLDAMAGFTAGTWTPLENIVEVAGSSGKAIVGGENIYSGKYYIFVLWRDGNNPADNFWRYNLETNDWERLRSPSENGLAYIRNGVAMVWDNKNYIYTLAGDTYGGDNRWFYRYSISENYWENLENTPLGQGPGGTLAWYENSDGEFIFAWIGTTSINEDPASSRYSELWRYNIQTGHWDENLKSVGGYTTDYRTAESKNYTENSGYGSDDGCNLVWAGEENYLYYLVGAYNEGITGPDESHFLRYNIKTNTFENLPSIPYNGLSTEENGVDDGGSMVWDGGNYFYVAKGGDYNGSQDADNFYRFNLRDNKWEDLPWLPEPISGGYNGVRLASLNGRVYYWKGSSTTGFWRFDPVYYSQGTFVSQIFDSGNNSTTWDNLTWSISTPSYIEEENDNVGAEPATLVDDNIRAGTVHANDYSATQALDGVWEQISENGPGETWTQTGWSGENVAPAQIITKDNASGYENYYQSDNISGNDGENLKLGEIIETDNIWMENFNSYSDGTENGTDNRWWIDRSNADAEAIVSVQNQQFEVSDTGGAGKDIWWFSENIDVSTCGNIVTVTIDWDAASLDASTEWIKMYYNLDGGADTLFFEASVGEGTLDANGDGSGTTEENVDVSSAENLQIKINCQATYGTSIAHWDNISISYVCATVYYENGYLESSVYDSGSASTEWGQLTWENSCPNGCSMSSLDYVGNEPNPLKDGKTQIGSISDGSM